MDELNKKKKSYGRWVLIRAAMVLFDIFAVNIAYFLALLIRYYVAFNFNDWAVPYISAFLKFSPFYTVACLLIFFVFNFYSNKWKYAGLKDLTKIGIASLLTFVIHVVGTLLFIRRMPISYYVLGAVIQFTMIVASRFSYRFLMIERRSLFKLNQKVKVPVIIIGAGETSHLLLKYLEREPQNAAKPVCLVDVHGNEFGSVMAGIPVVSGIEKLAPSIEKYGAESVILSDNLMSREIREQIYKICKEQNVDVQNFFGYMQDFHGEVTLQNLLQYSKGPVELVYHGEHQQFADGKQAFSSLKEKCIISSISAESGRLVIEIQKDVLIPNDTKAEWIQKYKAETGEDVSFF